VAPWAAPWPGPQDLARLARLGKFLVVGATGVAVNSLALLALHQRAHLPLAAASALAVELAIGHNFYWNNRWTFGRRDLTLHRFARFNLASLGGLAITTATLWLLAVGLGVQYLAANLVGIGLATGWNFGLSLVWTWKRPA
jgi:putative flippase GtrA